MDTTSSHIRGGKQPVSASLVFGRYDVVLGVRRLQVLLGKRESQAVAAQIICWIRGLLVKQCAETGRELVSGEVVHVQSFRLDQQCLSRPEAEECRVVEDDSSGSLKIHIQIYWNECREYIARLTCECAR